MLSPSLVEIKTKISTQHEDDEKQLEVIFSESPRLIVEAPAGYGKTTTMISRIAYLFASDGVPNPKRILGLTFSVNAALKVKRETAEKLPALLGSKNNPTSLNEKVVVTNYHGFCKGVLKKYGYLISDALRKDVNLFKAIGDGDIEKHSSLKTALVSSELELLKSMETAIKEARAPDVDAIRNYNEIVIKKLLPLEHITHNAVILFVLDMFDRFGEVKKFYQSYYPLIIVDEFQDTNCIAWQLLDTIISEQTQLLFLGDPLQRIYGFIGALPDIMTEATTKYQMTKVALSKNYRFCNNQEMLRLDNNIRANAASCFSPVIQESEIAKLPLFWGKTQQEEAQQVKTEIQRLMSNETYKIAVLFKARGRNAELVESKLATESIPYFYGMFKDDDPEYIDFHNQCQEIFVRQFGKSKSISRRNLMAFSERIKTVYGLTPEKAVRSLLHLLDALIEKVSIDYADLLSEDKYSLLLDIFENRQLKQAMEYVDSQIILSTIHGAKGLEWDYVIICDVEQWVFTFSCYNCPSRNANGSNAFCKLPQIIPDQMMSPLLDDLCVFYVGLTRARKQAYISASAERFNASGRQFTNGKICCLTLIDGIALVAADIGTTS